jgi:hypothetical protein
MSESNIRIVRQIYAAFGKGDVPAIMEFMSDDLRHFGQENSIHRFTFKDGKVVEWFGSEDTAKINAAYT